MMEMRSTTRPPSNQSSLALVPQRSLDLTKSVDLRQLPRLSYNSDLQNMLASSEQLLKKVYRLRKGVNSRYHPKCAELERKSGEVGRRAPRSRSRPRPPRPPQRDRLACSRPCGRRWQHACLVFDRCSTSSPRLSRRTPPT
jgi:hypothetical protein